MTNRQVNKPLIQDLACDNICSRLIFHKGGCLSKFIKMCSMFLPQTSFSCSWFFTTTAACVTASSTPWCILPPQCFTFKWNGVSGDEENQRPTCHLSCVITLTPHVQVRRGLEAPHRGEVGHRFGDGKKSIEHHRMSVSRWRSVRTSVRVKEMNLHINSRKLWSWGLLKFWQTTERVSTEHPSATCDQPDLRSLLRACARSSAPLVSLPNYNACGGRKMPDRLAPSPGPWARSHAWVSTLELNEHWDVWQM